MPIVIQRRRDPSGYEMLGQGMQQAVDRYIQGGLQMAQQQDANARAMASLGIAGAQLQRQAREDARMQQKEAARAKVAEALPGISLEGKGALQQLMPYMVDAPDIVGPMMNQIQAQRNFERQMAAQNAAQARQERMMNKPQLIQSTDQYGRPAYMQYFPDGRIVPLQMPGQAGAASPQVDASLRAELGQPTPALPSLGGEATSQPVPQAGALQEETQAPSRDALVAQGLGLTTAPAMATTRAGVQTGVPQSQALTPGTVLGPDDQPAQVPAGIPWGKQEKRMIGGKEYYGQPAGRYFKVGGEVPASALERKAEQELKKEELRGGQKQRGAEVVLKNIEEARKLAQQGSMFGIVPNIGLGSYMNWVPGTAGHDLERALETIKANIGFDKLQEMRAASPTGGALGAVSDFENKLLQSTLSNLATSQSPEAFMRNLSEVERVYNEIVHGPGAAVQQPAQRGGVNVIRYDAQGRRIQ